MMTPITFLSVIVRWEYMPVELQLLMCPLSIPTILNGEEGEKKTG
jgi:hypothetical protein